ncbi:MAG: hypothetical protein LBK05_05425, partial [Treponema sp.]|nr:hypothetical protein [Treponema sp.]
LRRRGSPQRHWLAEAAQAAPAFLSPFPVMPKTPAPRTGSPPPSKAVRRDYYISPRFVKR